MGFELYLIGRFIETAAGSLISVWCTRDCRSTEEVCIGTVIFVILVVIVVIDEKGVITIIRFGFRVIFDLDFTDCESFFRLLKFTCVRVV